MPRLKLMHFFSPLFPSPSPLYLLHLHPHISFSFFLFISLFFSLFFSFSLSDPRITGASLECGTHKYVSGTPYIPNFVRNMEVLSQHVTNDRWGNYFVANSSMYSLAQCMEDLSQTDCLLCYSESRTRLPRCIPNDSGRIFLDGCFLRYDTYNFFNEPVDPKLDKAICEPPGLSENYLKLEFARKAYDLIDNVTQTALVNGGFGVSSVVGGVTSVYGMAQCWKSLDASGCKICLEKAAKELRDCVPGRQGRSLNAGCFLRYSSERFYDVGAKSDSGPALSKGGMVALIAVGSIAFSLLALFGAFIGYKRHQMLTKERNNLGRLSSAVSKSNLNFKYETLEKATEFFDPSRKLGQGGAGSVFKGTLPDGKVVAVKRLFFNTRQWVDEFFNEVNLISGISHKNLVQLLGCSIEGPESLLVYEYVPNKSLDQIFFDKNHPQAVNWQQRFEIISGTAEGLAFLHGGTQTRIIHRDIKGSNILLNDNLTAKIADFGLARCFSADKTHLSTGIAGTLGYMAPEYLVRGQLTEKADVYSFGVLVLEIVCGRKNNVFVQESGSVLQTVWRNYKSHSLPNAVDPTLDNDFPEKQASNVLQIGLLCTQASAALRPSMSNVVQMLTDDECAVPLPKQPPFLNASLMDPDAPSGSFGMSTPASRKDIDTTRSSMSSSSTSFKSSNTSTSHHSMTIEISKTS